MNLIEFPSQELNDSTLQGIVDAMQDWVRVIDKQDTVIYLNKAMHLALMENQMGHKCYSLLSRVLPCTNCICRQSALDGKVHKKEEIIGDKVFSVLCSPVKNENGEIFASLEVLRDITELKKIEKKLTDKKNKLEHDLEMAKRLQNSILPKPFRNRNMNFSYVYMPCDDLGGDFLDVFSIVGNRTGIYIADVAGHGVSAAFLTMFLRSSLNRKQTSPAKALEELYADFKNADFEIEKYITIFYAIIDNENRKITYSNAGHSVSPLLISEDRFEVLRTPGIPISNWVDEPQYTEETLSLREGDRLFFCSDGITEIRNHEGEYFGEDRLLVQLSNIMISIDDVLERIVASAMKFAESLSDGQKDDVTLCMVEIK